MAAIETTDRATEMATKFPTLADYLEAHPKAVVSVVPVVGAAARLKPKKHPVYGWVLPVPYYWRQDCESFDAASIACTGLDSDGDWASEGEDCDYRLRSVAAYLPK